MGIEKYINALLDRKRKPAGTGGPVDRVAIMALARHADKSRAAAAGRRGGCLSDHEMAAFIELKKHYPEYDRAVRHMAGCAHCRGRAFDLSRLLLPDRAVKKADLPSDVIARAFTEAKATTVRRAGATRMRVLMTIAAAVAVVLSGLLYQAFRPHPGAAYITFYAGRVTLTQNGKPAEPSIKLALNDADTITTGENSFVMLQIDETIVAEIAENTTVTMKSLTDRKMLELFLGRGTVLSSVVKLPRGSTYRVATPTMVAAVKGTQFSVTYRPGAALLAVHRGAVGAAPGAKGKETLVTAGTTAVFTGKEKRRPISARESRGLEAVSEIPVVRGIESRNEAEILALIEPHMDGTAWPGSSLDRMKTRYGHIHTVTLYNGKVIEGIILHRGKNYIMLTPKGKISIPERQIRATRARYVRKSSQ